MLKAAEEHAPEQPVKKSMKWHKPHSHTSRPEGYILGSLDRLDCNTLYFAQNILVTYSDGSLLLSPNETHLESYVQLWILQTKACDALNLWYGDPAIITKTTKGF